MTSKARLESVKVEENTFIRELESKDFDPIRKDVLDKRMSDAEERRKSHERDQERRIEYQREKGNAASERLLSLQKEVEDKGQKAASQVDEAYTRWTSFTASVAERAAKAAVFLRKFRSTGVVLSKIRISNQQIVTPD